MSNLVIVESPAKAKTIQKYLGKDFDVIASMGHIRDLPKSKFGVDIENHFEPKYVDMKGKEDVIKQLKSHAAKCDKIYLATDPDREGEAISWHIAQMLHLDMQDNNRVAFNEITKSGVQAGMANPHRIDINLVNAQQARRVLDRIVGYQLSPFLWRKVRRGLSAGRVQSVAVRLVVDRENEIRAFQPQEYWTIDAKLSAATSRKVFSAKLAAVDGKKVDKTEISSKEQADAIVARLQEAPFVVKSVKKRVTKKHPSAPFITSTLQRSSARIPLTMLAGACSPCTIAGYRIICTYGLRRVAILIISRTAAPVGAVTTPSVRIKRGIGCLYSGANSPCSASSRLSCSKRSYSCPAPSSVIDFAYS